ncbi:MAG TPA: transcriptional repressor [Phnomibacter sp.]|nr:transcriptional repressor [Phnomibacter sp.]
MSVTESRRQILGLFIDHKGGALKHSDIEKQLDHLDRVTIYRTLQAFTEKGIIHTIPSSDGASKYALCHGACTEGHHHDDHVHFYCRQCETTQCLDHVVIPEVHLPKGFMGDQIEMLISGLCNECSKKIALPASGTMHMA